MLLFKIYNFIFVSLFGGGDNLLTKNKALQRGYFKL